MDIMYRKEYAYKFSRAKTEHLQTTARGHRSGRELRRSWVDEATALAMIMRIKEKVGMVGARLKEYMK